MSLEPPALLPPDDLELVRTDTNQTLTVSRCQLQGHNVSPDGKADPIDIDDQYFVFVYQYGDAFFHVRGLNPEMMSGEQISAAEANRLLSAVPYRVS